MNFDKTLNRNVDSLNNRQTLTRLNLTEYLEKHFCGDVLKCFRIHHVCLKRN